MQLERWIAILDRAKQVLVPRERQIGIVSTLQEQLDPAYRNRFVDLAKQLIEPEDVPVRRSHRTIKRAEVALRDAHVGVIDVAVDDVADDAFWMFPSANGFGQLSEERRRSASRYKSSASSASMRAPVRTLSAIE